MNALLYEYLINSTQNYNLTTPFPFNRKGWEVRIWATQKERNT